MIVESSVNAFLNIFRALFNGLEFIKLPTEFIQTLTTIMAYGNWIVGVDIMALFVATVVFWWGVHMSIGLAVWLWKMLPLT